MQKLDLNFFREFGYLQEVNRNFFHPLGLSLAVATDDVTGEATGEVYIVDSRNDLEGMVFMSLRDPGALQAATNIDKERSLRSRRREVMMGSTIQPLTWEFPLTKEPLASPTPTC